MVVEQPDRNQPREREIVVARYQENLSWLATTDVPAFVYNKGDALLPDWRFTWSQELRNEGREAQTFLAHIILQYDRLAEITFFVQGNPFDHCGNILKVFTQDSRAFGEFAWLADRLIADDRNGHPYCGGLPLGQLYTDLFGREAPVGFVFGPGAQFVTWRSAIHRKPVSWYTSVLEIARNRYTERYPWMFERLWEVLIMHPWPADE
jgi:hypothetical protein